MKALLTASLIALASTAAGAAEMITKTSPHSVSDTLDKLAAAVEGAGAKVFARVNHAGGAASVGTEMKPMEMLMFGNPKLGTPALVASATAGLDLPLRALAYEDADGQVYLVYHDPADLVETHGIPADAPVIAAMTGALDKLTSAATAQ